MTIVVSVGGAGTKNYGQLKEDIAGWLARDAEDSRIPDFVNLAESDICRDLRVRGMEKTATLSVSQQEIPLPSDYQSLRRVYRDADTGIRKLTYVPPQVFHGSRLSVIAGDPERFTIEGNSILFQPVPTDAVSVKILYVGAYAKFQVDADSNDLMSKHYDIYLYASLMHGFAYHRDTQEALKYKGQYQEAVRAINNRANEGRMFGPNLTRQVKHAP